MVKENKKFIFVGGVGAGKTTIFNALLDKDEKARKTQAVEFDEAFVDTPGEFFSHPRLYHALINTMADVETIVYVHPANVFDYRLPQGLLEMNSKKTVIGVISKTDLPDADVDRVLKLFKTNGFNHEILLCSIKDPSSITALKKRLAL